MPKYCISNNISTLRNRTIAGAAKPFIEITLRKNKPPWLSYANLHYSRTWILTVLYDAELMENYIKRLPPGVALDIKFLEKSYECITLVVFEPRARYNYQSRATEKYKYEASGYYVEPCA